MQLATQDWFGAFENAECIMNDLTFWKALYDRDCFQVMKKVAYNCTKASQQKPFTINLGKNLVLSSSGELLALIRVHHLPLLLLSTYLQGRNYCASGMRTTKKRCRIRANLKANLSLLFSLVQRKHNDKYWLTTKVQDWKKRFRPRKKSVESLLIIRKMIWITAFLIVTSVNGGLKLVQQTLGMMPSTSTTGLL